MSLRLLAALLAVALLLPAPALADGPAPAKVSPKAAYAAKAAGFPAPAREYSFRFDGVLRINGKRLGHVILGSRAMGEGEKAVWGVIDQIVMKAQAMPEVEISEAQLSRTFELLEGKLVTTKPGAPSIEWKRTETGFRAVSRTDEAVADAATETAHDFAHEGTALTTLAATIQFARMVLPTKARYESTMFEAKNGVEDKPAFQGFSLEVLGEVDFQKTKMLVVRGTKGEQSLELVFTPDKRELVAVKFVAGEQTVEMLKADVWSLAARSPKVAAARAAYAFGTGNVDVLDDVIHWPALYNRMLKNTKPEAGKKPLTIDAWRAGLLKTWRARLPKNAPAMVEAGIKMVDSMVKVEKLADGTAAVQYPPMFKNLRFVVGQKYGFWHLMAMPTQPKPAPAKKAPPPADAPKKAPPADGEAPKGK